jgi:hypothetical protein
LDLGTRLFYKRENKIPTKDMSCQTQVLDSKNTELIEVPKGLLHIQIQAGVKMITYTPKPVQVSIQVNPLRDLPTEQQDCQQDSSNKPATLPKSETIKRRRKEELRAKNLQARMSKKVPTLQENNQNNGDKLRIQIRPSVACNILTETDQVSHQTSVQEGRKTPLQRKQPKKDVENPRHRPSKREAETFLLNKDDKFILGRLKKTELEQFKHIMLRINEKIPESDPALLCNDCRDCLCRKLHTVESRREKLEKKLSEDDIFYSKKHQKMGGVYRYNILGLKRLKR